MATGPSGLKYCMKIDKYLITRLPKNGKDVDGAKELLALEQDVHSGR
jgi:hypothetical protein